jgi:hypothetical protein
MKTVVSATCGGREKRREQEHNQTLRVVLAYEARAKKRRSDGHQQSYREGFTCLSRRPPGERAVELDTTGWGRQRGQRRNSRKTARTRNEEALLARKNPAMRHERREQERRNKSEETRARE